MAMQPARRSKRPLRAKPKLTVVGKSTQGEQQPSDRQLAEDYPEEFLECREQHDWKVVGWYRYGTLVTKMKQCQRCTARSQVRYREEDGAIIERPRYEYPDGYQVKGHGHVPKAAFRAVQISHAKIFGSEDALLKSVFGRKGFSVK